MGVLTVPPMTELSVEQAAQHLGLSDVAVYKMIRRGGLAAVGTDPVRLALADVQELHQARQVDALRALERRRRDAVTLAREVRDRLHPRHLPSANLPGEAERTRQFRVAVLPGDAKTLFGLAALRAAASASDGCRWHLAREFAAADGGWAPEAYSEAFRELLGPPCEACAPRLYAPVMEALRSQVHSGRTSRTRPSAEQTRLAQEWGAQHTVRAAARPVGDDDSRALVSKNLRQARARLKEAKRRGDQRRALQLAQTIRSLEQDAAVVDGRAVTASARPGTLRCGHALSAGCGCPRRASR